MIRRAALTEEQLGWLKCTGAVPVPHLHHVRRVQRDGNVQVAIAIEVTNSKISWSWRSGVTELAEAPVSLVEEDDNPVGGPSHCGHVRTPVMVKIRHCYRCQARGSINGIPLLVKNVP